MARSKCKPMTEDQANILIVEMAVVSLSSLMVIWGTVSGWVKLKRKAVEVIDQVT